MGPAGARPAYSGKIDEEIASMQNRELSAPPSSRGLRAGVMAAVFATIACFGAAIGFAGNGTAQAADSATVAAR